jgi:hypothetical protein
MSPEICTAESCGAFTPNDPAIQPGLRFALRIVEAYGDELYHPAEEQGQLEAVRDIMQMLMQYRKP